MRKFLMLIIISDLLRKYAHDAWNGKEKREKDAIFYQTLSFNLSCTSFHECETEDIQQYISHIQNEKSYVKSANSNEKQTTMDTNKYLEREIASACRFKFPKEWTIIQLGKNFNANALFSRFEDIMTYNDGLSMTIFKHSAIQDMVMVDIKKPIALDNVFEKIFRLNKMITDNSQQCFISASGQQISDKEVREKYQKATQEIDVYVQDIVNNLTSFLGPWLCALTGNFKSRKSIETENEIRKKVMEFLSTRSYFTDYQQKLIHLVARRTDLLSHQQIFVAITYILEDKAFGYDDIDLNDLYDHLTWIKQEFKYDDTSTHPCILIVDELLDQLPFEMINLQQDFTRICSFANLKRLYEAHHGSFDINGHILVSPTNCNALVNPEGNLPSMEKRMHSFFNYWTPSWNIIYGKDPKFNSETLSQSDVFVFCGHGSGIHNVCDNVYNIKSRSVVFLFGCASVGLTTQGLYSELTGAHNYYHLGHCPCGKYKSNHMNFCKLTFLFDSYRISLDGF